MDALVLVSLGAVGGLFGVVDLALLAVVVWLWGRLDAERSINNKLQRNTKSIDPVISAIDSQRDFQLMMIGLGDLIDYAARVSPGGTKQLIKDRAPQLFEDRVA